MKLKKLYYLFIFVFAFILFSCGNETTKEPEVFAPRYEDVKVFENDKTAGSINIFIKSLDENATVYYVLVLHGSATPTKEQIKAGVNYGSVTIVDSGSAKQTVYKTVDGLEEKTKYDVHAVLENEGVFSKEIISLTVYTKEEYDVIDRGNGTMENPYKVFDLTDLENVASDTAGLTSHYVLMNDLDLSGKYGPDKLSFTPIGYQTGSLKKFNGSFDGGNFTIKNLYIESEKEATGLFAQVAADGIIKNLVLENAVITTTMQRVGALVGYNQGIVENIVVNGGSITSTAGTSVAGGAIGYVYDTGIVSRVYTNNTIIASGENVGGVIGLVDHNDNIDKQLVVSHVYSTGYIYSTNRNVGGVIGRARGVTITHAISSATVYGANCVGGIIGFMQQRSTSSKVTPSLRYSLSIGQTLQVLGNLGTQNYTSAITVANLSQTNAPLTVEHNYYIDTVINNVLKTGSSAYKGTQTTLSNITDTTWLKDTFNIDLVLENNYQILEGAQRPTLKIVGAAVDNGLYNAPYDAKMTASIVNGRQIKVTFESQTATEVYYKILPQTHALPTTVEMLSETKVNITNTVDVTSNELEYETDYIVFAMFKDSAKESRVIALSIKTTVEPLNGAFTLENASIIGNVNVSVTANKQTFDAYYAYTLDSTKVFTIEEIIALNNKFTATTTIEGLDDDSTYYIFIVLKTADSEVLLEKQEIVIPLDVEPLSFDADVTATDDLLKFDVTTTVNKLGSISYLVSNTKLTGVTKEQLTSTSSENDFTIEVSEYDTTYYLYIMFVTDTEDSTILEIEFVTEERPALEVTVEIALGVDETNSIVISFNSSISNVLFYYVVLESTATVPSKDDILLETPTDELEVEVTGLNPQTTYVVYVVCVDNDLSSLVITSNEVTTTEEVEELFRGEETTSYYPIYTKEDLLEFTARFNSAAATVVNNASLVVELRADIDLTDTAFTPIGYKDGSAYTEFKGTFNGNFRIISNLSLESDSIRLGFIEYVSKTGVVENIIFKNANINSTITGNSSADVGVAVCVGMNKGTVRNIRVEDSTLVNTNLTNSRMGAVIGKMNEGSASYLSVINTSVTGGKFVGGVIGHLDYLSSASVEIEVHDMYSNATVTGSDSNIGGVIGYLRVVAYNLVSDATVVCTGTSTNFGSVVGYMQINTNATGVPAPRAYNIISYKKPENTNKIIHISSGTATDGYSVGYAPEAKYGVQKTLEEVDQAFLEALGFDFEEGWTMVDGKAVLVIGGNR